MNVIYRFGKSTGRAVLLALLALVLVVVVGQTGYLALAQTPDEGEEADSPAVEVDLTVKPEEAPEATPTSEPEPDGEILIEPDDTGPIDPPAAEELGEPVKEEAYVSGGDVVDEAGGVIGIFDLAFVASHFGSQNQAADINLNGQVDIFDLSILASNYNQAESASVAAAIPEPEPAPMVEEGVEDFGALDLAVDPPAAEADVDASYAAWRPLRIGVGTNYVKVYDPMDGQSNTPPDLYNFVAVSRVPARTATWWNSYQIWPNWRLGWWRYSGFPWTPSNAPDAKNYTVPIHYEIRDDDGRICYGYYGCRDRFEWPDISSTLYRRTKSLTLYPNVCAVKDEAGVYTSGYWLDSGHNRCRVHLQAWGTEWPRAYASYFIDVVWD